MQKEINTVHSERILVVDDTTANLQLLTNLLTVHGYTAYPASDGELALEFVRSTLPDLILLDIRMPGMDGFEVCRRLKADERTASIPIIFISILEDERDKVEGFQVGAVDYISKPFQAEEVLARVRSHLRLRELTEHLEHMVAERTEEFHAVNAQLQRELAERKQAEAALRQSETLLNATQRLAKIGGWDWDVERQTSFWTEETYRIHGFEPQEFAPGSSEYIDHSLKCYDPADRPVILVAFQRCVQQGDGYDLEFPFTSADGCRKWIRTTATAVREEGRIVKVIGNIMDITERKQVEAELRRIEWMLSKKYTTLEGQQNSLYQGYGDLTALNHDGMILKSVGHDVLRSIAADYLNLLGTSSAIYEASGSYAFGIFTSNWCRMLDLASRKLCDTDDNAEALSSGQWLCHESCWTCCSKETIVTRAPVDIECSGGIRLYGVPIVAHETVIGSINFGYGDVPKDPVKLRALASVYHLNYEDLLSASDTYDSRPPYIVEMAKIRLHASAKLIGIMVERKQAEEALLLLNTELDRRVLERTAELEAANKEMAAFSYTVSHDLRAPLRHIDGFLELLQKKVGSSLDEQSRHYMDTISDSANKMGLLIDNLLSFSRMGSHAMSFQQVDMETLVREVIRELEPDAAGRNIAWCISDLPAVGGDATLLRVVLSNLISNALKFTRPRQKAQIEIGSLPGHTSEAVIFVRDNGVGFDMTYVDKLFGVFQRLHRADEFEGTGIGLANVRRIIARHGGRTWAEGKEN